MNRNSETLTGVSMNTALASSTSIAYGGYAGGQVVLGTTTSTKLTWYVSVDGVTFKALQDGAGTAIESTISSDKAVPIPDGCFGARFLKAVADVATATVSVTLKS